MNFLLLLAAALCGGMANALAGGGTFLTFPMLVLTGLDPIVANATSAATMIWGGIASLWVYSRDTSYPGRFLGALFAVSVAGGLTGSTLLLITPSARFALMVPFLMLGAALVYSFSEQIARVAERRALMVPAPAGSPPTIYWTPMLIGQYLISCYGGYFGAGMGVLMIVLFVLTAQMDVQQSAALRFYCTMGINGLAVMNFAYRGVVRWDLSVPMAVAAVTGGYLGARIVRILSPRAARRAVLIFAWTMTVWLFIRTFA